MSEQPILLKSVLIFTNPKGQHNSSLAYQKMDEVQYQTSIYVATEDIPAGVAISDARWVRKLDNSAAYQAELARQTAEGERKQAEDSRETAEGLREQGEIDRGNAYSQAELARDGLYATAESARDGLFASSQQDRTSAYNLREGQRDSAYESAELARGGLYESAESARDGLYENAEAGREQAFDTAEIVRNQMLAEGIEAGRLNHKGPYNPSTLYSFNNWVTDSGSSYAYINPTPAAGVPLTDTSHWQQIASIGGQDLVDAAVAARDAAQGYKDAAAASAAQLAAGLTSPGVYATFAALVAAKPTGDTKIYVVTADGYWYYWNGSAWVAGGQYQSTGISNKSVIPLMLNDDINSSILVSFSSSVVDLSSPTNEIAQNRTVLNREKVKSNGNLSSLTLSVAIAGTIKIKMFSRNQDNTFNLEKEFSLPVQTGIRTYYAGRDFPETSVVKDWYIGYFSTNARLFCATGGVTKSYQLASEVTGVNALMAYMPQTIMMNYSVNQSKLEFEKNLADNLDYTKLSWDILPDTQQKMEFNPNGSVKVTKHKNNANKTLRWDDFRYTPDKVIETRSIDGKSIELIYDLKTFETKINKLTFPNNLLAYDSVDWIEWNKTSNVTVVSGDLQVSGTGHGGYSTLAFNAENSTKYGVLFSALDNTITHTDGLRLGNHLTGSVIRKAIPPEATGNVKLTFTTQASVTQPVFPIGVSVDATVGRVLLDKITLFKISPNTQLELDFDTLTADELAEKYIRSDV